MELLPRGNAGRTIRKAWLREHRDLWPDEKALSYRDTLPLFKRMQTEGLYSPTTMHIDAPVADLCYEILGEEAGQS